MEVLYEACRGLGVHQATGVACARRPGLSGRRTKAVRTFGTTTGPLLELVDWLTEQRVTPVARERTGVLWKPLFNVLEPHVEVVLANAAHGKAIPADYPHRQHGLSGRDGHGHRPGASAAPPRTGGAAPAGLGPFSPDDAAVGPADVRPRAAGGAPW